MIGYRILRLRRRFCRASAGLQDWHEHPSAARTKSGARITGKLGLPADPACYCSSSSARLWAVAIPYYQQIKWPCSSNRPFIHYSKNNQKGVCMHMDYVTIDFETANSRGDSVCPIGLSRFSDRRRRPPAARSSIHVNISAAGIFKLTHH